MEMIFLKRARVRSFEGAKGKNQHIFFSVCFTFVFNAAVWFTFSRHLFAYLISFYLFCSFIYYVSFAVLAAMLGGGGDGISHCAFQCLPSKDAHAGWWRRLQWDVVHLQSESFWRSSVGNACVFKFDVFGLCFDPSRFVLMDQINSAGDIADYGDFM